MRSGRSTRASSPIAAAASPQAPMHWSGHARASRCQDLRRVAERMGYRPDSADGNRLMEYTIAPLSEHTGAEVRGIDLTEPIEATVKTRLNRAFVDRSVLVFRDQHLAPHQLVQAVGLFGEIFPQHNSRFALTDCPPVHYISNKEFYPDGRRYIPGEGYHTDHSNAPRPPKATALHAVSLPEHGGDTQYVN